MALITLSDILLRRGKKQLQKQHQNETCCHNFGNGFHFELSDTQHFSVQSRQDKKIFFKNLRYSFFFSFKILARYPSSFRPFRHRGYFDQEDFGNRRSRYHGNGMGRSRLGFPSERRHFRKNYAFTDPHTLHTITRIG